MTESGRGKRIAILIGTNEYSKVDKLEFAENDAKEMGEVLLDQNICGFDEVIELIDKTKEEVSHRIEKVFKNAKKDDEILIYFSGHGKPSYKFDLCLLFKDTDPESLLATSLKFDYINECKDQSSCNRVVVILDCCYSGTAGMKGDFLQEMLSTYTGSGTILLTSTGQTGSNIAKEDKELKHGVFTHYLLKGLKDWAADHDNDGVITVDDLYRYTFNETKAKGLQRPQIKGSYEGEMVLGRNPQKIRDRDFELKKEKLMQYLSSAPSFVIHRSFAILQKMYNNPSALEPLEVKIKPHLESLLNDEIQAETYVEIVKYQEKLRKQQEEEQKQKERLEREKREKEEQEKLRKQRDEKLQRQREEERKKEKKFLEIQQLEEQERLRNQKEEAEKLKEVKRKAQEEADKRKKEQEELSRQREEVEQKQREEERKREEKEAFERKQREEEEKAREREEAEGKEKLERKKLEEAGKVQEAKQVLPRPPDKNIPPKKLDGSLGKGKPQTSIILVGIILGLLVISVIWLYWGNVQPPTIEYFNANPETVTSGENITLNWSVSNATRTTITPGIGDVKLSGSISVSPTENTTYALLATNKAEQNVSRTVTVEYIKRPTITSLEVNPAKIVSGNNSTLNWSVSGDANVTINPEIGNVELSGSKIVRPTTNTTYTITAWNEAGNDSVTRVVTVEKRFVTGRPTHGHGPKTGENGNDGKETNPIGER